MAFQIKWTARARTDLAAITGTIRSDNPSAADRFGAQLLDRVNGLANHARLGAVYRRHRGYEIRQITFRRYRIFYRVRPRLRLVEIVAIWHGARREPKLP